MPRDGVSEVPHSLSRQGLRRLFGLNALIPLFAVLMFAGLWTGTWYLGEIEHLSADTNIRITTQELTETYEAQVVRALREIDQKLALVEYALQQHGPEQALSVLASKDLLLPTLVFTIAILDRDGRQIDATDTIEVSAMDFEQLQWYRNNGSLRLAPSQKIGDSKEWTFQFSRRLTVPEGTFTGIAILEVDAAFFVSSYDTAKLGQLGMLGLVGDDGEFRVRRVGDTVSAGGEFLHMYLAEEADSFETRAELVESSSDGVERYISLRELFGYPLSVVVGLSRQEQLTQVQKNIRTYIWRSIAGSGLLLLVVGLLWRMSYKLAAAQRREVEARVEHAKEVEYLAYHDALTGLPNRSLFTNLLNQSILQAQRYNRQLAVLFLDLDHFKYINDTLGHEAGDFLLKEVASRLKHCLRKSDTVARLGGDEFVMLLPEIDQRVYAAAVAQKIIAAATQPYELKGDEFRISVSIGIATYPEDGLDEQTLTKNADVAMYKVKEEGKNNFYFYSDKIQSESLERLALESSLKHALEEKQFNLHYQAKREMVSGQVAGLEALLRWEHPDLGTVMPVQFIPIAEASGLILPIGKWVIRRVCEQSLAWQQHGMPPISMAVNLTTQQFFSKDLLADISTALNETGVQPDLLELEVGEDTLLQNVDRAIERIGQLKDLGVCIAIDNFGVGYSSLNMLKKFSLDSIKIDRTFMRNVGDGSEDTVLAEAIMALGRTLGMTVVAQGVETEEQASFLRDHACDQAQGYYFDEPMPLEQLETYLQEHVPTKAQ